MQRQRSSNAFIGQQTKDGCRKFQECYKPHTRNPNCFETQGSIFLKESNDPLTSGMSNSRRGALIPYQLKEKVKRT